MDIKPGYEQTEVGVIPEDWDVKMLGELTNIDSDNLSSSTSPDYEFNYISLEDVESGTLKQYSLQQYYLAPSRARRRLTYGDVMVSTVRPNLKSHLLFRHRDGHWVCSTGFSVISCINQSLLPEYVFYHLFSSVINWTVRSLG